MCKQKKILVLGSLNLDLVTTVRHIPKVGETIFGSDFIRCEGGKGANQAVAMAKLGADVTMFGMVGADNNGKRLKANLDKYGVNSDLVYESSQHQTGVAVIMVTDAGENSIVVLKGSNFGLTPDMVTEDMFANIDIVVAQFEVPQDVITRAFEIARKKNIMTILNPAPATNIAKKMLEFTDIIVPNETEFEIITGFKPSEENDFSLIKKGAKDLFRQGVNELIVTLGANGVFYLNSNGDNFHTSAYKVDAVDTTAAGDSFIGGFVTKLADGFDVRLAIKYAVMVSAIAVTRKGAQTSLPSSAEVDNFKGQNYEKR